MNNIDRIVLNASVFTADPANPRAEAVAMRGNRIVAVGSNAEIEALCGPGTRVIGAEGRTVMPGFIDTHFHLLWGSLELADAQLGGVRSLEELSDRLRAFAAEFPDKPWLAGQGMPYLKLPGEAALTRRHLDRIIPDRPLAITTYDGHTVFANTAALTLAGLLHGGDAGPGSEIVMLPDGTASGELREPGAFKPVTGLIPEPDGAEKRALLHRGLAEAAALGITSVHNMDGDLDQLTRYAALEDVGELTLRVYAPYSVKPETVESELEEAVEMSRLNPGGMARGGAAKFFMDGVIESYTALMLDDYTGAPGNKGDALYSADHFNRMATACDALGLQIFTHAIGDGAVRRTLDGYAAARTANGVRDSRHRVEHLEVVHPDDLPRFVDLGVIAAMQPEHAPGRPDGADIWPARVGTERWDRSFAWRTVRNAGVRLVFGSDWPVVTQSPILGIHAALNRKPWTEGGVDHSQALEETLASYTREAAYAEFKEGEKGMLKAGYLADVVMLSEDIFACPGEEIARIRPVMTVCDGRVVFEELKK
ncbi:MAG TPA: amidohydrolase [Anaerolineales bacterium]|nr:amidohydrolase [Anaerolineales bacterium]